MSNARAAAAANGFRLIQLIRGTIPNDGARFDVGDIRAGMFAVEDGTGAVVLLACHALMRTAVVLCGVVSSVLVTAVWTVEQDTNVDAALVRRYVGKAGQELFEWRVARGYDVISCGASGSNLLAMCFLVSIGVGCVEIIGVIVNKTRRQMSACC